LIELLQAKVKMIFRLYTYLRIHLTSENASVLQY